MLSEIDSADVTLKHHLANNTRLFMVSTAQRKLGDFDVSDLLHSCFSCSLADFRRLQVCLQSVDNCNARRACFGN